MGNIGPQRLSDNVTVFTSVNHSFGTDAFLLADFARPRTGELACDLGTGCGIIPLLWCSRMKTATSPAGVWGADIQPEAAELFRQGVEHSQLSCPVYPTCADLRETDWVEAGLPAGKLHLVTCNPPYFAANTGGLSREDAARTARHEGMCTIDEVCRAADKLLRYGGRLAVCLRPERLADAVSAFREWKLEPKRLQFVAKNAEAAPWLFLLEGKKGGKPGLKLLPQRNLYQNGEPTQGLNALYR